MNIQDNDVGYYKWLVEQQKEELRRCNAEVFKQKILIKSLEAQVENWKLSLVNVKKAYKTLRKVVK
jgi:hypothetical protein